MLGTQFRRMRTRPSREASISGAVLGPQAIALAALYPWFRAGDVETFARNFFEFQLADEYLPRFARAALNTVILAVSGEALGIALELMLGVFALSTRRVARAPARAYIKFLRGNPLLWQLIFFFFGIALACVNFGPFEVAILVGGAGRDQAIGRPWQAAPQRPHRGCAPRPAIDLHLELSEHSDAERSHAAASTLQA